jgi:murein DD-endopeptidase MepM/ murein hydrolase activator NlpD
MIPAKAIKPIRKNGRDSTEIAVGTLIAYRVFPQTQEGIEQAKKLIASSDEWLVPSMLPEYYDDIDSDLMTGKENDAIRAITKQLKQFYGISSAGTEAAVDTRSARPQLPSGIPIKWFGINQVSEKTWRKLKARLTGIKDELFGKFSSFVNLSERDADKLIQNIKQSGYYPGLENETGDNLENYINWLVDTYLPEYGKTQVYNPGDKFVDNGKEFADKIIDDFDNALEEKSNDIMDAIDAIIEEDKRKFEEFKAKTSRTVNHPELYSELQHIKTRYMWGQNGLYDLEFKSDIDRAIYFAGKLGGNNKDSKDKSDVREWLFSVTGLNVRDDYDEIKKYRAKILELILQLVKLKPQERDVIVPPVYDGYYQDPDEDEEEGDAEDEENDDLYGSNLDNLLSDIRVEEENNTDEKEVDTQAEIATEVLNEAEDAREQAIDESVFDDLPEGVRESLVVLINKRKGKPSSETEHKKPSSYVSNNKIFKFLTTNLYKIQGQLDSIDRSIQDQTSIVQANLQVTSNIYENLDIQNKILGEKLDAILQAFNRQNELAKKFADEEENRLAEQRLENGVDVAGTETPMSTIGSGKGSSGNSLLRRLTKFFGRKLASQIFKRLPYGLKRKIVGLRKLKRLPGKLKAKVTSKITSKLLQRVAPKIATKPAQAIATRGVAKGFEHIALPGVTRAVQQADKPVAKVIEKGGGGVVERALKSPAIQKALIRVLGKEGAEKLTVKIAAKLIPGISTAYGLGEGLARIAMGDVKGGFLSFGSAIPVAGYGFAAIDILRDINPDAYTKHIESNLPAPSDQNFAAFFADALGVTEDQYETGGVTRRGIAMLHGTEAVVKKDSINTQPVDPVGGTILAATTQYINKLGSAGSSIAPMFEQVASPLAKVYGMPSTLVQTNVGGSLPSLQSTMKKIKEKKKSSPEEELGTMETDLLKTTNPESFADKLLKMIDPEGKFQELLKKINNGNGDDAPTVNGDSLYAEGGEAVTSGDIYSAYGMRSGEMHNGIDLSSAKFKQGTPISVIKPGKVVFAGWQDPNNHKAGWGQFVAIKHDDGTASLYGHLDQINVSNGQRVEPDSSGKYPVIGKLGNTGSSTGAHLHFEVGTGWTGGTLTGHMNPASVVGEYLRGGGNVKKKESTGDAPQATLQSPITSGQDITQNYGMETGNEKEFTSGNKKYKAHKTKKGFEFFDGATRIETSGGSNNKIVRDFMESQGTQFERVDNDRPADEFMRKNGIVATPVAPQPPAKPNPNTPKYQPNITPPIQQPTQPKYYLRQGSDSDKDTQIIMIPAASSAGQAIGKNATVEGQQFSYDANYNTYKTNEVSSTTRALVLRRLGLN